MLRNKKLLIVILINLFIFIITNVLFNIKYEQVDDFIIYNLYSGLDGTYNIHGIYIHPVICFILSLFFKIIPIVNWHTIFLLILQFTCFTLIGYTILKKNFKNISVLLYIMFASIFYTTLLMLIQYTSVAALLIGTSLFLLINLLGQEKSKNFKYKLLIFILFTLGIMIRMQSIIIIIPFFIIYFIKNIFEFIKKEKTKKDLIRLTKYYSIYAIITLVIYLSSLIIYNSNKIYEKYIEYNDIRSTLHDIIYVDYEKNKDIFDEIGWNKNDHYIFYTFGFGDEQIYSKNNLEKVLRYKEKKDGKYSFNIDLEEISKNLISEEMNTYTYISLLFLAIFIFSILLNKKINKFDILIFLTTLGLHIIFLIIGRSMHRVIIPEYIMRYSTINI